MQGIQRLVSEEFQHSFCMELLSSPQWMVEDPAWLHHRISVSLNHEMHQLMSVARC